MKNHKTDINTLNREWKLGQASSLDHDSDGSGAPSIETKGKGRPPCECWTTSDWVEQELDSKNDGRRELSKRADKALSQQFMSRRRHHLGTERHQRQGTFDGLSGFWGLRPASTRLNVGCKSAGFAFDWLMSMSISTHSSLRFRAWRILHEEPFQVLLNRRRGLADGVRSCHGASWSIHLVHHFWTAAKPKSACLLLK